MVAQNVKPYTIGRKSSVKIAMQQLDAIGSKILFVVDGSGRLIGSLTDGDIRRWILKNGMLSGSVDSACNKKPFAVGKEYGIDEVKAVMTRQKIPMIPVVDGKRRLVDVLMWDAIFGTVGIRVRRQMSIPVVIMAGGKGTRLDPFTRILPKALIPIGEKPVIEVIIDRFRDYGITSFHVSINHKSRMIKAYFEEVRPAYDVFFLEETKPLGTAGGLSLLKGKVNGDIFVINCDILIESDLAEIVDFHRKRNLDVTLIGALRHYRLPYGVCEINGAGNLKGIKEKPEFDLLVNTGFYLLKSSVLNAIPNDTRTDMTDLIDKLRKQRKKIGVFPISERSWIDVGEWEEFKKASAILSVKSQPEFNEAAM